MANKITQNDIDAAIKYEFWFKASDGVVGNFEYDSEVPEDAFLALDEVLVYTLVLHNGTKIVGVNYGSVDPADYDLERAKNMARADAVRQLWPLLGYELRSKLKREPAAAMLTHKGVDAEPATVSP